MGVFFVVVCFVLEMPFLTPNVMHLTGFILPIFRMENQKESMWFSKTKKYKGYFSVHENTKLTKNTKLTALKKERRVMKRACLTKMRKPWSQNYSTETRNKWNVKITPVSKFYRSSFKKKPKKSKQKVCIPPANHTHIVLILDLWIFIL